MKRLFSLLCLVLLASLLLAACSTDNSGETANPTMPGPNVRVEAMPSATAAPPLPAEIAAPSPQASPTAPIAQYYIEPTPDEDAIANQIQALIDEIDRKLATEKFIFNP